MISTSVRKALDDEDRAERALGMEAGMHLLIQCEAVMIGGRFGISEGMGYEIGLAHRRRSSMERMAPNSRTL